LGDADGRTDFPISSRVLDVPLVDNFYDNYGGGIVCRPVGGSFPYSRRENATCAQQRHLTCCRRLCVNPVAVLVLPAVLCATTLSVRRRFSCLPPFTSAAIVQMSR